MRAVVCGPLLAHEGRCLRRGQGAGGYQGREEEGHRGGLREGTALPAAQL